MNNNVTEPKVEPTVTKGYRIFRFIFLGVGAIYLFFFLFAIIAWIMMGVGVEDFDYPNKDNLDDFIIFGVLSTPLIMGVIFLFYGLPLHILLIVLLAVFGGRMFPFENRRELLETWALTLLTGFVIVVGYFFWLFVL